MPGNESELHFHSRSDALDKKKYLEELLGHPEDDHMTEENRKILTNYRNQCDTYLAANPI